MFKIILILATIMSFNSSLYAQNTQNEESTATKQEASSTTDTSEATSKEEPVSDTSEDSDVAVEEAVNETEAEVGEEESAEDSDVVVEEAVNETESEVDEEESTDDDPVLQCIEDRFSDLVQRVSSHRAEQVVLARLNGGEIAKEEALPEFIKLATSLFTEYLSPYGTDIEIETESSPNGVLINAKLNITSQKVIDNFTPYCEMYLSEFSTDDSNLKDDPVYKFLIEDKKELLSKIKDDLNKINELAAEMKAVQARIQSEMEAIQIKITPELTGIDAIDKHLKDFFETAELSAEELAKKQDEFDASPELQRVVRSALTTLGEMLTESTGELVDYVPEDEGVDTSEQDQQTEAPVANPEQAQQTETPPANPNPEQQPQPVAEVKVEEKPAEPIEDSAGNDGIIKPVLK